MIYTFDKKQNILRALDENNFLTAELTFKINEAATFSFTVTPEYELTDKEKYVALPHPLDQTKFIILRLISRTDNKDDIEYTAYEYAYQELSTSGYIKDTRPQNANALTLMTKALDGSGWSVGRTTVAGTATTNFYYTDYLSAVSKVVDLLGGEIVFYVEITGNKITGRYMDYLFRQGVDTSKVFSDGSNLLSVARKKQSDSIYTAILPRGKGEQVSDGGGNEPDGYGRRIDIKDVVWSKSNGKPLNKPAGSFILEDPQATAAYGQANGNARLLIKNFDEVDDPNVLIQQAYNMLMTMNHPLIEYSATVADVGGLSLGDTVLIMHGRRNLSYKTRVFQVKYDLLHSENTELSLGDNLSSNNITSQINTIRSSIQTNSNQQAWTVSRFGRPSTTFGATQPTEPKIGDTWFKSLPDGNVEIWHYNGTIWVKVITPTTGEEMAKAVDDAVTQAKEHTATAIEQNNASQQDVMNDIAKSQADLAIKDGDFNNKAQAMADKALSDAKANTVQVAQETLNSANDSIAQAKYAITDAYKNADGVISKKVDDTATSIGNTISQNKIDSDGKISTAQSTATQAINAVTTKVSQTDYNKKTGDLTTAVSKAQTTADGAVSTVGNYKTSNDGRVKAAESKIKQNSKDITARVSQTDYNNNNSQLNTRFTKVEATADGASTTVGKLKTTVNNLGQVNQLINTEFSPDFQGWYKEGTNELENSFLSLYRYKYLQSNVMRIDTSKTNGRIINGFVPVNSDTVISFSGYAKVETGYAGAVAIRINFYDSEKNWVGSSDGSTATNSTAMVYIKQENILIQSGISYISLGISFSSYNSYVYISKPMLVFDSKIGKYSSGNYNNNAALAQVKITADSISNFVRDSSGNISSNFQTALGKTSIVTGTTLASSIQKQTSSQISSALTDNNGKIISLINQDSSGVQISGKNIVLDGNTTVTGDFYAKGGNFKNLNASNLNVGTLNGNQVNITNVKAENITGDITNFIQSNWNGVYRSTTITSSGMTVQNSNSKVLFNSTGMFITQGSITQQMIFGKWSDSHNKSTSATGSYLGISSNPGNSNIFTAITGSGGGSSIVITGNSFDWGANRNIMRNAINMFSKLNLTSSLVFQGGNNGHNSTMDIYIESDSNKGTLNFRTGHGSDPYFWFNRKIIADGSISSSSLLSKKLIYSDYTEDALSEIRKTRLANFSYLNDTVSKQVSPIIDDVNTIKQYYVPNTILSSDMQHIDLYSMITMAWKAIQQLNEKIGEK